MAMSNKRDDFKAKTKMQIKMRAGFLCSFPRCRVATVGATSDEEGVISVGMVAHICAAAPGGPRYDKSMSSEERSSARNGMLMCESHGKAINSKDSQFTVDQLREWKQQAENESLQHVLDGKTLHEFVIASEVQLVLQIRSAAETDINVFCKTSKWPSTSVSLMLKMDGADEPVTTSILADVVLSRDDLILVASPGMGKTTTIFQVAEKMLSNGNGVPLVVLLGDWATSNTTLLDVILQRPAFRKISEECFRKAVSQPGFVLLLDGWNELDSASRKRARVQVEALKAELPELGLIISTRKQSLDVPFEGMRIDLMPLNEEQQMLIAVEMQGDSGAKILEQAWRTYGLRELVTIPLYLTTLLSLPKNAPFPSTKEEVLRHFVDIHENTPCHAEVLLAVTEGFQQSYLDGLAVSATQSANTAISDRNARLSISKTATVLVDDGQIATNPQPKCILDVLVNNHVLISAGGSSGYSFQHQQFQEWFASHSVEQRIIAEIDNTNEREILKQEIFDLPVWEEAILFAVERLSRGGKLEIDACGKGIIAAFEVAPILAAEMIFRSTDEVWSKISVTVQEFIGRWHTSGKVDRAFRFMLTSGRHEFFEAVWPLITNENDQISLEALRHCSQFRPSILGDNIEEKIKALPRDTRIILLCEMVSNSGMDGFDLVSSIVKNDPDPEVQASVIDELAFRRADSHVVNVLLEACDKTFDLLVSKNFVDEVRNEQITKRIVAARKRQSLQETSADRRLRSILYTRDTESYSREVEQIISTMDIEREGAAGAALITEALSLYPQAVADGLLARVLAGRELFYGVADILAATGLVLENDTLVQLVLENLTCRSDRAIAAASVLGLESVIQLLRLLLDMRGRIRVDGKFDRDVNKAYSRLQARIAHVPSKSLVQAVLSQAGDADNEQMACMAELLALAHPSGVDRIFDEGSLDVIQSLIKDWGSRILASANASRSQAASIAALAVHAPSSSLLPILKRLLDNELHLHRNLLKQAEAKNWQSCDVVNEAQSSLTHEYERAFSEIKAPETTDLMQQYLTDEYFGMHAARVLANQWIRASESDKSNYYFGGIDFSGVKEKRSARAADPDGTSVEAEMIFDVIESVMAKGLVEEQKTLVVELGIIASRLPHGQRDSTIQKLINLAPMRVRERLLLNLVLSGESISSKVVFDGIADLFEAAKVEKWILEQSDGYELRMWLHLLPFVDQPEEVLSVIRGMPLEQKNPHFLKGLVEAFSYAPECEAEEFLFKLAEEDPRFYIDYCWRKTVIGLGTLSSARRIIDLTANGEVVEGDWHFIHELGGLINTHPSLREHIYNILRGGSITIGLEVLIKVVTEYPDEEGVLMLVKFEEDLKRPFLGYGIKKVVTEQVDSENWKGAYETVPASSIGLRRKLLARTSDGGPSDIAARLLNEIDEIRDEYGGLNDESRHPDLTSGKSWPIIFPSSVDNDMG